MEEKQLLEEILHELKLVRYEKEDRLLDIIKKFFSDRLRGQSCDPEDIPTISDHHWVNESFCEKFTEIMFGIIYNINNRKTLRMRISNDDAGIEAERSVKRSEVYNYIDNSGATDDIKLLFKLNR